ncbi:Diacylglycerol kinase (ATP) [Forsythia ovata]|uniref:Diacylglycerol kinase (ATP) n=1 Tax=Forsythia ovata TaxID=205694 RepID=A0ABD1RK33_9LAMI
MEIVNASESALEYGGQFLRKLRSYYLAGYEDSNLGGNQDEFSFKFGLDDGEDGIVPSSFFFCYRKTLWLQLSIVNEVNATKKNWALRVLVVRAYETSSRDNPDERSTLEYVFQDMKKINVVWFRLQLRVVDDTSNAAILVWNHEAVDLLGKTVAELKAEMHEQGNEKGIPFDFEKLEEREMLFMVQVRHENVRKKSDVFSVTKLSVDPNIISKYAEYAVSESSVCGNFFIIEYGISANICCQSAEERHGICLCHEDHGQEFVTRENKTAYEKVEHIVFDLSAVKPHEFVQYGLACLKKFASPGDSCAKETREKLRVVVAGGDGSMGWVLGCLGELNKQGRLPVPPAVNLFWIQLHARVVLHTLHQ